jgi:hypothetical protein
LWEDGLALTISVTYFFQSRQYLKGSGPQETAPALDKQERMLTDFRKNQS